MKQSIHRVALTAILSLTLAGCGQHEDPVATERLPGRPAFVVTAQTSEPTIILSTVLDGYLVQFDGRSFAGNLTTFSYTVTETGAVHALSNFFLEIPGCAPALDSFTPEGGAVGVNPLTGLFGIKWDISLGMGESRSYSMTFPGDVPLGVISTAVKAGETPAIGEIAGPCAGFLISGTVYVDADSSGDQIGPDETGISSVTVTIEGDDGITLTSLTDVDGHYAFIRSAGTYTVGINTATSAEDFNEVLGSSFDPTGPAAVEVTVGPGSPDNDFGYYPRAKQITLELATGALLTTGEQPRFWVKELRGGGRTEFDSATMAAFLSEIQGLFLPDPFQFTPGDETKEAINILKSQSKDPIDQLLKELLAAELNEVSGKGLVDEAELQSVLLAWVESLIAQSASSAPAAAAGRDGLGGPQRVDPSADIGDALDLLKLLNGATGGGGSGGEG